jgi:hypothetical protein
MLLRWQLAVTHDTIDDYEVSPSMGRLSRDVVMVFASRNAVLLLLELRTTLRGLCILVLLRARTTRNIPFSLPLNWSQRAQVASLLLRVAAIS